MARDYERSCGDPRMSVPSRPIVPKLGRKCLLNMGVQENLSWCPDRKQFHKKNPQNPKPQDQDSMGVTPWVGWTLWTEAWGWPGTVTPTHPDHKGA